MMDELPPGTVPGVIFGVSGALNAAGNDAAMRRGERVPWSQRHMFLSAILTLLGLTIVLPVVFLAWFFIGNAIVAPWGEVGAFVYIGVTILAFCIWRYCKAEKRWNMEKW